MSRKESVECWLLMKSVLSEVRRARPLLGTFVDVTAEGEDEQKLHQAIGHAFAAVSLVHGLMNLLDPRSEIGGLYRSGAFSSFLVLPWTARVLRAAKKLSRASEGLFDVTAAQPHGQKHGSWRDLIFLGKCRLRLRRPLAIDLGGIAKGFAVDCAVERLIACAVRSGVVNAGGDLRVFGPKLRSIHIRHPSQPERFGYVVRLRERSLATSALSYAQGAGKTSLPYRNGRTHRLVASSASVSVHAAACMTADALTKVVFAAGGNAEHILRRHRAGSLLLWPDFSLCELGTRARLFQEQTDESP